MSLFFLSYAHEDNQGGYVGKFFDDLCAMLNRKSTYSRADIGFRDFNIAPGARWLDAIEDEVATCRVFLALCSPKYFASDYCGKEWRVFADRLAADPQPAELLEPLLIPIYWEPEEDLEDRPTAVGGKQFYLGPDPASPYLKYGLMTTRRNQSRYKADYDGFLTDLARRMRNAARDLTLATTPRSARPGLGSVSSAFVERAVLAAAAPVAPDRPSGPGYVHFLVAAPTTKTPLDRATAWPYYGNRSEDWTPFHPADTEPLVRHAQKIALDQRMTPYLRSIDNQVAVSRQLLEQLERAEEDNELLVLLVDPWATTRAEWNQALASIDTRLTPQCGAVVAWNENDPDNHGHTEVLTDTRKRIFRTKTLLGIRTFPAAVKSPDEFRQVLIDLLINLQNLLFEAPEALSPRAEASTRSERPLLAGPVG